MKRNPFLPQIAMAALAMTLPLFAGEKSETLAVGKVAAIDGTSITVFRKGDGDRTFNINDKSTIVKGNGAEVAVADIKVGWRARITFDPSSYVATKVIVMETKTNNSGKIKEAAE